MHGPALAACIREWSLELLPAHCAASSLQRWRRLLGPRQRVFVPWLPAVPWGEVLRACDAVRGEGWTAVPHIAARRLQGDGDLAALARGLRLGGITTALLLAGGEAAAASPGLRPPFSDTMELLAHGSFLRDSGLQRVCLAAHPEGNPLAAAGGLSSEQCLDLLARKIDACRRAQLDVEVATQLCLDPARLHEWLLHFQRRTAAHDGHAGSGDVAAAAGSRAVLVRLGVAGPLSLAGLLKWSAALGVAATAQTLRRLGAGASLPPTGLWSADGLLAGVLARGSTGLPPLAVHVYSLGAPAKACAWIASHTGSGGQAS